MESVLLRFRRCVRRRLDQISRQERLAPTIQQNLLLAPQQVSVVLCLILEACNVEFRPVLTFALFCVWFLQNDVLLRPQDLDNE